MPGDLGRSLSKAREAVNVTLARLISSALGGYGGGPHAADLFRPHAACKWVF